MVIEQLFQEDINRKINGVVQVEQDATDVLVQELDEYVITRDLKKHFITFFNNYGDSFHEKTADIGVWISGFFGSGKSHFLKMLSYLLANQEVQGVRTVERFRKKFKDDPATFMLIDSVTTGNTDTILFNIDIEGSINKNATAVLRVFAKMFYNYLGFYGENLKVAKLEQFIDKRGKTTEFRLVFEEKNGGSWIESRDAFAFFEDDVVETLKEVLGMSEEAARNWFNGTETVETSISQLVSEMKEYVDNKPDNFRLLFMVDEVGQYVGGDTNLLLNLQSLIEKIGSECGGKIWVVCTGQEAIDEIIKARENEFSRIQARFKTRLSLTSSSADEVIQKRILKKKPEFVPVLEQVYNRNDSVLRNLFSFSNAMLDIKGYTGPQDFAGNFPFVPYQFIMMQKVFSEIRKHGNSGKHFSGGERSMLSGFQEAAQKIQDKDEYALVPFYLFYDTVHTFLDSSIRRVIERCQKAADNGDGIEQQDVCVLKLLYLIRYVDDIPSNLDNIVILMANDIRLDKITMRDSVQGSLDRLLSQNYIGKTGDTYNFLTDEEQDIQRDIYKNTQVDTSAIVERIGKIIFADIYTTKKYRHGKYDFPFDRMVDATNIGAVTGGMRLRILTVATDTVDKDKLHLMTESKGQAIVVLSDTPYYESLEKAMKVRKYVKQRNVAQLPKSVQDIIRRHQDEAAKYETSAEDDLKKAIVNADFYVDGEHIEIKGSDAKSKLDQALEYLVTHVYSELGLITKNADTDADILAVLNGAHLNGVMPGMEENHDAAVKMEEYLEMQAKKLPTSMADIQSRYQAIPYGWKEIDIAVVAAMLIYDQKVTIKYGGETIRPDNPKLPDMLRKKSEIGKTGISKRQVINAAKMRAVKEFLREYFDVMDVPDDEDGLVAYIIEKFTEQKAHYEELNKRYEGHKYPDHHLVQQAIRLTESVLSQRKDNIALTDRLLKEENNLLDNKDDMQSVEGFFKNQVQIFDAAVRMESELQNDLSYLQKEEKANQALNRIRKITVVDAEQSSVYKCIPELNGLMDKVREGHGRLLEAKRAEILEILRQCMSEIHITAAGYVQCSNLSEKADKYFDRQKTRVAELKSLQLLDGLVPQMFSYKDDMVDRMEAMKKPVDTEVPADVEKTEPPASKKVIKNVYRQAAFPSKTLESQDDIDAYVERMRAYLTAMMKDCDGIKLC
ncbi:BREX system P-loop protein BrxC [Ruminococcus sp.]|uniref:BREX system P-loop protein BrxC n=1 Tax=Ruminococcus sp. TaxID=41978 RepID=UPI003EFD5DBA